jgi:O-antigen ligase
MTQNNFMDRNSMIEKKRTFYKAFFILLLTFLAFSRFVPGGNVLAPETGTRGAIEVSLLALTFLLTFGIWGTRPLLAAFKIPVWNFIFLFGLWAAASAIWSPNYWLTLGNAFGLMIITITTFTIIYQVQLNGLSLEKLVFGAIIVFLILLLLINFAEKGTLLSIDWSSKRHRLLLVFDVANVGATYFSAGILLAFHLLLNTDNKGERLLYFFGFLIFSFFLYLTNARTEMAAVIIALLVIVILHLSPKVIILVASVLSALVFVPLIMIMIVEPNLLVTWINNVIQSHPDLLTLNGRIPLWRAVISIFPSINLWYGVGYTATRFQLLTYFDWATHTHNAYLEILMGTGVIGILIFFLFYIHAMDILLLKAPRKYIFPLALLIYISITSIDAPTMFLPRFSMVFLILFVFQSAFHLQINQENCAGPGGGS